MAVKKTATAYASLALTGSFAAPGDKSISHRAIIFGALAEGETQITGLLTGADIISTIGVMRDLGAGISEEKDGKWRVRGVGDKGLSQPNAPVDCGNAGTGVRLIMGAAAPYPITVTFTGDSSLSSRPMGRILEPLRRMGLNCTAQAEDRLPATLSSNGQINAIDYISPHASAQVKSAILLAGLGTKGTTSVTEPRLSRDHTENMLRAFGVQIDSADHKMGRKVSVLGPVRLRATTIRVPGDPSSAAFPIVAALITPGSMVTVENVMMNPTRTGLLETLAEMGANIKTDNFRLSGGEVMADITVSYSSLRGVYVPEERAPAMIDEYPILAVAAAYAKGETIMEGIAELRVKESDRISATVSLLRRNGVEVSESHDGMRVTGCGGDRQTDNKVLGGGTVQTHHDHRIAMSALVLGLNAKRPVHIDDTSMIATSFPSFFTLMDDIGAKIELEDA